MRSQSLRIFITDFNTNYIIIYLMPSRADSSFLRYHETGVRADQLCAAGRPDPETFLAPCRWGYSISHKATVPSSPLSSCFFIRSIDYLFFTCGVISTNYTKINFNNRILFHLLQMLVSILHKSRKTELI